MSVSDTFKSLLKPATFIYNVDYTKQREQYFPKNVFQFIENSSCYFCQEVIDSLKLFQHLKREHTKEHTLRKDVKSEDIKHATKHYKDQPRLLCLKLKRIDKLAKIYLTRNKSNCSPTIKKDADINPTANRTPVLKLRRIDDLPKHIEEITESASSTPKINSHLKLPLNTQMKINLPKCHICGKHYTTDQFLQEHLKTHQDNIQGEKVQNEKLEASSSTKIKIHSKLLTQSSVKINLPTCHVCGKYYTTDKFLQKHLKTHESSKNSEKQRALLLNSTIVKSHSKLPVPTPTRVKINLLTCQVCGKYYTTEFFLQQHMKGHQSHMYRKKLQCKQCKNWFSKIYLKKHIRLYHSMKKYFWKKCSICGKLCKDSYALKRHLESHKPYK